MVGAQKDLSVLRVASHTFLKSEAAAVPECIPLSFRDTFSLTPARPGKVYESKYPWRLDRPRIQLLEARLVAS
jgi:hypothetical protein